jgi:3',5'-cyclic AMP phosphodiesterase CpdA
MTQPTDQNQDQQTQLSRRAVLGAGATGSLALLAGATGAQAERPGSKPVGDETSSADFVRLAHFADIHARPEAPAPDGFRSALKQAEALDPEPAAIICTGDMIHGGMSASKDRFDKLWQAFHAVKKTGRLKWHACLGNHDIWGWDKKASETTGKEEGWGKARALAELSMGNRHQQVDLGHWQLILLDSLHQEATERGYMGMLDEEQFDWLSETLADHRKPTLIASHMPILAAAPIEWSKPQGKDMNLSTTATHRDAKRLVDLFRKYSHVKLCISGHIHLRDRIEYAGVTYILGGAVSGNWWRGSYFHFPPGFGTVDLHADGGFQYNYHPVNTE